MKPRQTNQFKLDGTLIATFPSVAEASESTSVARSSILQSCNWQRHTAGGYIFLYSEDEAIQNRLFLLPKRRIKPTTTTNKLIVISEKKFIYEESSKMPYLRNLTGMEERQLISLSLTPPHTFLHYTVLRMQDLTAQELGALRSKYAEYGTMPADEKYERQGLVYTNGMWLEPPTNDEKPENTMEDF